MRKSEANSSLGEVGGATDDNEAHDNIRFTKKCITMDSILRYLLKAVHQVIVVSALAAAIVIPKGEIDITWMGRVIRKEIK